MSDKLPLFGFNDASFNAAGGTEGLEQLVDDFYTAMETLPEAKDILAMHRPGLPDSRDKLAKFLSGWLGGPRAYQESYGEIRIPAAHSHLGIGPKARDAWLLCMEHALEKQDYSDEFKRYFMAQIAIPAHRCQTRTHD
ncbi:MAG: group II truncated hemoglobin [Pontibacterium sp.]